MIVIILNGPPGCGKDTAANFITEKYNAVHMKFSWPLKRIFDPIFRVGEATARKMVDEGRDTKQPLLNNLTPREVQISFFRQWLQPVFGDRILGTIACRELESIKAPAVVFSDGYHAEVEPVIDMVGAKNVKCIRISRPEYNYGDKGDYRDFMELSPYGCQETEIENKHDLFMYQPQVDKVMNEREILER